MRFRTELEVPFGPFSIDHSTRILSVGSCFADRIGNRLVENKFRAQVNPFGVLFNPFSLIRLLERALNGDSVPEDELFLQDGLWHSFDFHSDFSHPEPGQARQMMDEALSFVGNYLQKTDLVLLTLGTAKVWRQNENQEIVANCHKVPPGHFETEMLKPEAILENLDCFLQAWRRVKPDGKLLLTVSPVRHAKDGLEANAVSKGILRYSCHRAVEELEQMFYFPAYELVIDDLRDYRFYEKDLVHPNQMALDYVWEKFSGVYFSKHTRQLVGEWQKVKAGLQHRPLHPGSGEYKVFLESLLGKLKELAPKIDLAEEVIEVERRLRQN